MFYETFFRQPKLYILKYNHSYQCIITLSPAGNDFKTGASVTAYARKASRKLRKPASVQQGNILFTDHFTSDSENSLTIKIDPSNGKASGYQIKARKTGTTNEQMYVTKDDSQPESTIYSGKKNTVTVTIPRNTLYTFSVRAYNQKGSRKKYTGWTSINYFPSTDDSAEAVAMTRKYMYDTVNGTNKNVSVHGNVVTALNDFQYAKGRLNDRISDYKNDLIMDLNGHTIADGTLMGNYGIPESQGALIISSSVPGQGVIKGTRAGSLLIGDSWVSSSKIIINDGTFDFKDNAARAFNNDERIGTSFCIGDHCQKTIINGGTFTGHLDTFCHDTEINDGNFHMTGDVYSDAYHNVVLLGILLESENQIMTINHGTFYIPDDTYLFDDITESLCFHYNDRGTIFKIGNISMSSDKKVITIG